MSRFRDLPVRTQNLAMLLFGAGFGVVAVIVGVLLTR